ncbi:MAG: hypothetical protein R3205_06740 [Psychrobacter sp.]|uniref:hypothetical protein n=1 Tax=Psychrobacter maritimus TaxID=256325 RepID=UPI00248B420B|nr:hypothetical protein [Psychrobacter sp. WB2]MDX1787776.1 hypothetical protein [Psychrobacter sp.]WGV14162.1 hypothetical protein QJS82_05730 [Psychrobacter sp. WB2]
MNTQQVPASIWQQMIQQNFLSLYDLTPDKITDPEYLQGYDFVFEFSNAVVYLIVNDVTIQADRQDIDSAQVRRWRKDVVNQLIKQHAQLYLKNDKALAYKDESKNKSKNESASDTTADKAIYFIGLTALSVQHQDIAEKNSAQSAYHNSYQNSYRNSHQSKPAEAVSYAVGYEYGSQFFAEDCVLDLDDEESVLQVFSYQNFTEILKQLVTPSDLTAFLDFHRGKLTGFEAFQDESTLLVQFLQSPDFHQRAIKVQEQLVSHDLIAQIEPRLLKAAEPEQAEFAKALMAEIQKNTRMWYQLFNSLVRERYDAGTPLPKEQVDILVDESMYTYACLVEKILAHRTIDQDSRWSGYVRHEHSYNVFGRHYLMVFYAQDDSSSLSADKVRAGHQDLLFELNAQMQQPVMQDLFLIGVGVRPCENSVNTEVHLDAFHQHGSLIDANTQRLYEQLAELRAQS